MVDIPKNPESPQNQIPNEPDLMAAFDLVRKDILINLNCMHLGTIQSFDPVKQLATVTINYKRTFYEPVNGLYKPKTVAYPVLTDRPVVILGGGNGYTTYPIEKGDECLVLFNDRDINNWYAGSNTSPVATARLHSFSDGFVLVGVKSKANVLEDYNADEPEFRTKDGSVKAVLKDDRAQLQAGAANTLAITDAGKLKVQNTTGEFVTALIQALSTATAGGFPLIADLSVLQSFQEI